MGGPTMFRFGEDGRTRMDPSSARGVLAELLDQVRRTGHTLPVKAGGIHPFTVKAALGAAYDALGEEGDRPMPDITVRGTIEVLEGMRADCTEPGCNHSLKPHQREALEIAIAALRHFPAPTPRPEVGALYPVDAFNAEIDRALRLVEDPDAADQGAALVHAMIAQAMATAAVARRPPC